MSTFLPGQTVKFKQTSHWRTIFGDETFSVVGNMRDSSGAVVPTMYELRGTLADPFFTHADDIMLAVTAAEAVAGTTWWWQSAPEPSKTSDLIGTVADVAVDVGMSLPKQTFPAPEVFKAGGGGDFGGAGATGSWTDDLLASVGSTISKVHESTAGVLSSTVDSAGSICSTVGDTIGSAASGLGDVACAVGDGIGSVASGVGDVASGIGDAIGGIADAF